MRKLKNYIVNFTYSDGQVKEVAISAMNKQTAEKKLRKLHSVAAVNNIVESTEEKINNNVPFDI
ncbi:MAG: hypothetical protein ACK6DA_10720 [Candidatus Kapaibacterium sp.]|jgi:hypothetical protein